jgi:Cu(I)/Ag(I) efflux system membrane protein CusA/SilA
VTLPDGKAVAVRLVPFYDRTDIVKETLDTLSEVLTEEVLGGDVVGLIFLLHLRSSLAIPNAFPFHRAHRLVTGRNFSLWFPIPHANSFFTTCPCTSVSR